jgi:lysozyme
MRCFPSRLLAVFLFLEIIVMTRSIDAAGEQLVKSEELCAQAFVDKDGTTRFRTYDDKQPQKVLAAGDRILGILTIGYGHTGAEVKIGLVWTRAQADAALDADLAWAQEAVAALVPADLSDNRYAALVDLAFNIGAVEFRKSRIVRLVKLGRYDEVPAVISLYRKSQGVVMAGLVRRRAKENLLWSTPDAVASFTPAAEASLTPDRLPRLSLSATVGTVGSAISVAGGAAVTYAPGVAATLQQAATELQPMTDYGRLFRIALEAVTVLGGLAAVIATAANLRKHGV